MTYTGERAKEYNREWYRRNSERVRERQKAWILAHPEQRRAKQKRDSLKRRPRQLKENREAREAALVSLGKKCCRCGFDDVRALQIDHVHGGGCRLGGHGTPIFHREVIRSVSMGEEKYQLLCANCNWIKRAENGEYRGHDKQPPAAP